MPQSFSTTAGGGGGSTVGQLQSHSYHEDVDPLRPRHSYHDVIDAPSPRLYHGLDVQDFHSEERTTRMRPAVFSLINTVVGGGTLSLAYSFQAAGSVVGAILLTLICLATDFTLFALISASRRTGAKSYEDVMKAAFGVPAQLVCTLLVFIITFLTPVAYLILLRGLLAPIIEAYITHAPLPALTKNLVIGAIALGVTPLSSFHMGAIGSLAAFSMASILVLAAVVGIRGYECLLDNGSPAMPAVNPHHFDILGSVPVFVSSFLCHFNVLPLFGELRAPTRERAHNMVHATMASTLVLYLFVGLMGYAYAQCRAGSVPDNILNAFPADDPLVNVARLALVVVLCFCFPLLLMPCRDSLIRLLDIFCCAAAAGTDNGAPASPAPAAPAPASSSLAAAAAAAPSSVRTPLLAAAERSPRHHDRPHEQQQVDRSLEDGVGAGAGGGGEDEAYGATDRRRRSNSNSSSKPAGPPFPSSSASTSLASSSSSSSSPTHRAAGLRRARRKACLQKLLLTYLLVLIIITLAVLVDSVALIWAVIGSFGCIAVGFVCPTAAYLKVGCRQQRLKRLWAWVILCGGALLLVACVLQTVVSLTS